MKKILLVQFIEKANMWILLLALATPGIFYLYSSTIIYFIYVVVATKMAFG